MLDIRPGILALPGAILLVVLSLAHSLSIHTDRETVSKSHSPALSTALSRLWKLTGLQKQSARVRPRRDQMLENFNTLQTPPAMTDGSPHLPLMATKIDAREPGDASTEPQLMMLWNMRRSHSRTTNCLCILLILAAITASIVTFCITRNPLSFSFLSSLGLVYPLRRRTEHYLYPISNQDFVLEALRIENHPRARTPPAPAGSRSSSLTPMRHEPPPSQSKSPTGANQLDRLID